MYWLIYNVFFFIDLKINFFMSVYSIRFRNNASIFNSTANITYFRTKKQLTTFLFGLFIYTYYILEK